MELRFRSQRVALPFFYIMVVLWILQVAAGLIIAIQEAAPYFLQGILNFNIARSIHLNLAVFWVVSGFIGTAFYITPLLTGRDLRNTWLPKLLAVVLPLVVLWDLYTLRLAMRGVAGMAFGEPWLQRGLPYLEGGMVTDLVLFIGFGIAAYVVIRSLPHMKNWNELHWGLALGLGGLFVIWVFAMVNVPGLDLQEYFRWYVVHYWVEAVWEVLHITFIGFLLMTFFGAGMEEVGFAVFWGVVMIVLSGLIGNAHHYFWIGTPAFWQFWGSLFSALEPLPIIFCFWHVYLDASHGSKPIKNLPAFYFLVGSAVLEMVGAGILGFSMTFAATNLWEHGTWVTLAHAHLALFGTFGMLVIGAAYCAVPALRDATDFDQRIGKTAFWACFGGILLLALVMAFGGSVQVYVYRVLGLSWWSGEVLPAMWLWKALLIPAGLLFTAGTILVSFDFLTMGAHRSAELPLAGPEIGQEDWMPGFEFGSWLALLWTFGFIVTAGLLSYNLPDVRAGNSLIPYGLAGVGYTGLLVTALGFVRRFLLVFERRQRHLLRHPLDQHLAVEAFEGVPAGAD